MNLHPTSLCVSRGRPPAFTSSAVARSPERRLGTPGDSRQVRPARRRRPDGTGPSVDSWRPIMQSSSRLAARRQPADDGSAFHRAGDRKLDWTKPPPGRWKSMGVVLGADGTGGDRAGRCTQVADRPRTAAMAAKVVVQSAGRIADTGRPTRRLREQWKGAWRTSMRLSRGIRNGRTLPGAGADPRLSLTASPVRRRPVVPGLCVPGLSFRQPAGQPPDLAQSRRPVVQLLDADVDVPVRRRRLLLVHVSVHVDRAVRHLQQRHVGQQQRRVARRVQRRCRAVDLERADLVDRVDVVICRARAACGPGRWPPGGGAGRSGSRPGRCPRHR